MAKMGGQSAFGNAATGGSTQAPTHEPVSTKRTGPQICTSTTPEPSEYSHAST
ncbi:hypothetical protein BH769_gp79 [Gordonia phage BritBrat]|uniref:Uncharacterized protein n=1 Tax=Gordonia phage BritBrat TaxID=1838064 RepID=A0A166Y0L7_9CAUD|nr:hypothetical protein BH769_gp79 [Gordonia phage BritBrat]ANA85282.1 hypothetical protein PBI_BRITBRAT_79 [Gordonia phage BritBrat]